MVVEESPCLPGKIMGALVQLGSKLTWKKYLSPTRNEKATDKQFLIFFPGTWHLPSCGVWRRPVSRPSTG